MTAGHNRLAAEVVRDTERCERHPSTNASDENLHARTQTSLRHHHSPGGEMGKSKGSSRNRVAITHFKEVCDRGGKLLAKASRTMLANHKDVIRSCSNSWAGRIHLRNGRI